MATHFHIKNGAKQAHINEETKTLSINYKKRNYSKYDDKKLEHQSIENKW